MKCILATAGSDVDVGSTVAAFFSSGVAGRDLVLLDIVGSEAVEVRQGIWNGRFVGLNAINGHVEGAVPRTVYRDT